MPIYEYKCTKCGQQIEVMQKMKDNPLEKCEACGGELKKMITSTSFVLKGSGWYVTDYPSEARKKAMDAKKPKDKKVDAQFKEKSKAKSGGESGKSKKGTSKAK